MIKPEHGHHARLSWPPTPTSSAGARRAALKEVADLSFNSITVDGDTSTNDSFMLIATGQAGNPTITDTGLRRLRGFRAAVLELAIWLAQAIVRDGEGATKFMTLQIEGGQDRAECRKVGYAIGHLAAGQDRLLRVRPNLGRILAAIGYAGIDDLDVAGIKVWLGSGARRCWLPSWAGGPRNTARKPVRGSWRRRKSPSVDLWRGQAGPPRTCDFPYDYVKINADYRS